MAATFNAYLKECCRCSLVLGADGSHSRAMAALEKLVKAAEALKMYPTPTIAMDTNMTARDKCSHCMAVADALCAQAASAKSSSATSDFAKYLTLAMEMFFTLIDDADVDVRILADEQLNRLMRALGETYFGRLQVELYKEIKRNGSWRVIRSALSKFADLAHLIRPQKYRAYVTNLIQPLVKLAAREEEAVHEAVADSLPRILHVLGSCATESDIEALLKAFAKNLLERNAVIRRCSAHSIRDIVSLCGHTKTILPGLLRSLTDLLLTSMDAAAPEAAPAAAPGLLGSLVALRLIVPKLHELGQANDLVDAEDFLLRLLQIYEACLRLASHSDHNVVAHALETLQQLLRTPPAPFRSVVTSPAGIPNSCVSRKGLCGDVFDETNGVLLENDDGDIHDLEQSVSEPAVRGSIQFKSGSESPVRSVGCASAQENVGDQLNLLEARHSEPSPQAVPFSNRGVRDPPSNNFNYPALPDLVATTSTSSPSDGIGSFYDLDIPLIYCARRLTLSLLLTRTKGCFVPNAEARVSVKMLALGCLTNIFRLSPKIFLLTLMCDHDEEDLSTPLIRDVTNYSSHEDHQLRGCVASLVGAVLKAAEVESGGRLLSWFNRRRPDHFDICRMLEQMLLDPSSSVQKTTVQSIREFLRALLTIGKGASALPLLRTAATLGLSRYWLVKQELCRLIETLPFTAIAHATGASDIQQQLRALVLSFLGDEDQRVRAAAAHCVAALVEILYVRTDDAFDDPVASAASDMVQELLLLQPALDGAASPPPPHGRRVQSNLFRFVTDLTRCASSASSPHHVSGCVEALALLTAKYPPAQFPVSWGCQGRVAASAMAHLARFLTEMMTRSALSAADVVVPAHLMNISARVFAALAAAVEQSRASSRADHVDLASTRVSNDDAVDQLGRALLRHSVKALAIFAAVVEGTGLETPTPPSRSSSATTLSPVKKSKPQLQQQSTATQQQQQRPDSLQRQESNQSDAVTKNDMDEDGGGGGKLGAFAHSPHYCCLFETVRSVHTIYQRSSEQKHHGKKLQDLLGSCLGCVSTVLDEAVGNTLGSHTEEVLGYLRSTLSLEPSATLRCVESLLRCLFKGSVDRASLSSSAASEPSPSLMAAEGSMFALCFDAPYNELVHTFHLARDSVSVPDRVEYSRKSLVGAGGGAWLPQRGPKSSDRTTLASYIRLFEPMVIKALKYYTLTSDVEHQSRVLQLLICLVKLRVNYCLLDSEQIFIGYVLKQLELIEDGLIKKVEKLIPKIFQFVVLLSYERYHSKIIIDIAKILRLCEGLFASGQDLNTHVLPALIPVAEDLFCHRSNIGPNRAAPDQVELDAQREVVLNMILKLIVYPDALRVLVLILEALRQESEEKWRKTSRTIVNIVLPLLASHRIHLDDQKCVELLRALFSALSPGCLRPVDQTLTTMLTSPVEEDASLQEVQRWLGFIVIALPLITNQSPEEGILSRLEELGIQIGSGGSPGALLDSSLASSTSSSEVFQTSSPERTLALFVLQVIGASVGKLHQLLYCQPAEGDEDGVAANSCEDVAFLQQLLSQLLLFACYMFQSGRYVRVTRSARDLSWQEDGLAHVSQHLVQLSHRVPYLALQWLHVLVLLGHCPHHFWSRILSPDDDSTDDDEGGGSLNQDVLYSGALILYCDFLCDNVSKVECTSWLLMNHVSSLVRRCQESPVQDFLMAMHRVSSSSGLLLQAVMTRCESQSAGGDFLRKMLSCLENVHAQHSAKLLVFLVQKFLLRVSFVPLARQAHLMACKRAEQLLLRQDNVDLPSESDLAALLHLLRNKRAVSCFSRLISLLNRMSLAYPDLSPVEADELRTFNPGLTSATVVDKQWFATQVRQKCSGGVASGEVCAKLLEALPFESIVEIVALKDFNLGILPHSMKIRRKSREVGGEGSSTFSASKDILLLHIKAMVDSLPRPASVYTTECSKQQSKYVHKMANTFRLEEFRHTLLHLLTAFKIFVDSELSQDADSDADSDGPSREDSPEEVHFLARFGVLALEFACWLSTSVSVESMCAFEFQLSAALAAAAATFKLNRLFSSLSSADDSTLVSSSVFCLYEVFERRLRVNMPRLDVAEPFKSFDSALTHACIKLNQMLHVVLHQEELLRTQAKDLQIALKEIVLGLCRIPVFHTYVRVPPEMWSMCWTSSGTTFPIPTPDMLLDPEMLKQFARRINAIGWSNRQQFEEHWVSLLGVFGVAKEELSEEEVKALTHCMVLAVPCLTTAILRARFLPTAGTTSVALPLHKTRDAKDPFFATLRGQQLTQVQNLIQYHMERTSPLKHYLYADCTLNLERCSEPGSWSHFGLGQFSVEYLVEAVSNKRPRPESEAGLDLASCIHFLIELYTPWMEQPQHSASLLLLTRTVSSVLLLSDAFAEASQFAWMAKCFLSVQRSHPAEDEMTAARLCVGICKSAACLGPAAVAAADPAGLLASDADVLDLIKRMLEANLKSSNLPSRIFALHGVMYVLQSPLLTPDQLSPVVALATEYLAFHLHQPLTSSQQQQQQLQQHHLAIKWSLTFFLLEHFAHDIRDPTWIEKTLQQILRTSASSCPGGVAVIMLSGLERLVVGGRLSSYSLCDQVMKLATDLLCDPNPAVCIPATQLFLTGMYSSSSSSVGSAEATSMEDPEQLMRAMERMSILFDCVRRSGPSEARLLCDVLPRVLVDFFPAADVINRVISEFISPGQPHQILLSGVLFAVFSQAARQDQTRMLQEWVLMALPNFTRRVPVSHSAWCLSCFFISACSHSPWLQAIYPYLQQRFGFFQHEDKRLFCLAAREFYQQLSEDQHKKTFVQSIEAVAAPDTIYYDLLQCLA